MRHSRIGWALALIVLWTLGVRLLGIDFGVPWYKEPDTFIADHVRMLREGEVKLDRALSICQYPSLLAHLTAPFTDDVGLPRGDERTLAEHHHSAAAVWIQLRLVVALISILIVPATFAIARRFMPPPWALYAAALPALSLLHVCFSQQARAHGVVVAFSACAVACALWVRRAPSWRSYLATTSFAFLAVGTLHNGLAVLLPIAVAQWTRVDRKRFDPRLLLVGAAAAISFRTFYWYYFDPAAQAAMRDDDATQGVLRGFLDVMDGSGFGRLGRTLWFYEPLLLALLVVALATWLGRSLSGRSRSGEVERGDLWVVLAYVVPYTLLAGFFDQTYERFLLPLLPYLAVFGTWSLWRLSRGLPRAGRAVPAVSIALLALPAFVSTKLAWLRSRPDTMELSAAWIREQLPEQSTKIFVMPPIDFPWMRTEESLRWPPGKVIYFSPWARYQARLEPETRVEPLYSAYWIDRRAEFGALETEEQVLGYLRSFGPGLFVSEVIDARMQLLRVRVSQALQRHGRLLERISPDGDPNFSAHPLWAQDAEVEDWPNVFWRVLRARAVGPVIEIYRFDG